MPWRSSDVHALAKLKCPPGPFLESSSLSNSLVPSQRGLTLAERWKLCSSQPWAVTILLPEAAAESAHRSLGRKRPELTVLTAGATTAFELGIDISAIDLRRIGYSVVAIGDG